MMPLGVRVARLRRDGLTPGQLGALLWSEFNDAITERFASARLPGPVLLTGDGLKPTRLCCHGPVTPRAGRAGPSRRHGSCE
jgi:hypothetical protein